MNHGDPEREEYSPCLRSSSWKGPQLGPRGLPAERSPGWGSLKGRLGQLDKFSKGGWDSWTNSLAQSRPHLFLPGILRKQCENDDLVQVFF